MQKTIAWIPDPRNVDLTELSHIKPLLDNNAQPDGIVMCGQPLSKCTVEEEFRPNQTLPVGHRGFIVKFLDKCADALRRQLQQCTDMSLRNDLDIPTVQLAHLLIRESFATRHLHLIRVLDTDVTATWCETIDHIITEAWNKAVTVLPDTDAQKTQIWLPIRLGGFGIRSYLRTAPAAHIASWVCFNQMRAKYEGITHATIPEAVITAAHNYTRLTGRTPQQTLQRDWDEICDMPHNEVQRALINPFYECAHAQVTANAKKEETAYAVAAATEIPVMGCPASPGIGLWLTARPQTPQTVIPNEAFRLMTKIRGRYPIFVGSQTCSHILSHSSCGHDLGTYGDHTFSCAKKSQIHAPSHDS